MGRKRRLLHSDYNGLTAAPDNVALSVDLRHSVGPCERAFPPNQPSLLANADTSDLSLIYLESHSSVDECGFHTTRQLTVKFRSEADCLVPFPLRISNKSRREGCRIL